MAVAVLSSYWMTKRGLRASRAIALTASVCWAVTFLWFGGPVLLEIAMPSLPIHHETDDHLPDFMPGLALIGTAVISSVAAGIAVAGSVVGVQLARRRGSRRTRAT